jgi:hypothetical protein
MLARFSSFFSFLTGRYAPAFITLLVLAGIFFFYFNVIVTTNEANLKERNFRGLHRMADNVIKKINSYSEDNSKNFLNALKAPGITEGMRTVIENQYSLTRDKDSAIKDTLPFYIKFSDGWKFYFKGSDSLKKPSLPALSPINKFITPLLRRDLFQYYFLSIGDTILWDELNISNKLVSSYLPPKTASDSVRKGSVIQTGDIRTIEIQGKEYKLFLLPFIAGNQFKFQLGGYMPIENYVSEQRYIPTYAIVWLVIGIVVVILMFPLLKIFLMHPSEQLHARNAVYSLASLFILGAVVVLAALNTYMYFSLVKSKANTDIKELAYSIDSSFTHEVDTALLEMDSAEARLQSKLVKAGPGATLDSFDTPGYKPVFYPYFLHISWTDISGAQRVRWASQPYLSEKIDVRTRDYFTAVRDKRMWTGKNGKPYYLTEISSRVENKNLAIIARPFADTSKKFDSALSVITLSSSFRSMFNTVLPDEFGFCLIKEDGDILFHYDQNRNLNENLVEECDNDPVLLSLIHARNEGHFGARYAGSSQRFYIKPVESMPYYIVVFRCMKPVWAEDLDIISACSIFTLMNLAVILLAILITQVVGYRQGLLKHSSISFSWLQPNKNLSTAYQDVTLAYISAIILQAVFFGVHRSPDQLSQVGIAFSYTFLLLTYAYYKFTGLNQVREEVGRSWKKLLRYKIKYLLTNLEFTDDGEDKLQAKMALRVLLCFYFGAVILFFLNLCFNQHGCLPFLLSQLLLLPFIFTVKKLVEFLKSWKKSSNRITSWRMTMGTSGHKTNYRSWYITSVFGFIAATAIMPSVIFYYMSFKQERILSHKQAQLSFARRLMQQPKDTLTTAFTSIYPSYRMPFYYRSFADMVTKYSVPLPEENHSRNYFEQFYKTIKPAFSSYSTQIEFLKERYDTKSDINWSYLQNEKKLLFTYKITSTNSYLDSIPALAILSPMESGIQKTGDLIRTETLSFLGFILLLMLMLWGFFCLLRYLLKKIFFYGYNDSGHYVDFESYFIGSLPPEENIYIVGLINSGKYRTIRSYVSGKEEPGKVIAEFDIADLRKSDEEIKELTGKLQTEAKDKKVVILRHFEMFMDEFAISEKKLLLLESLIRNTDSRKQIVILSARSFEAMTIVEQVDKGKGKDYTDRWSNVMNKFYTAYHHCQPDPELSRDLEKETIKTQILQYCTGNIDRYNSNSTKPESPTHISQVKYYLRNQLDHLFDRLEEEFSHSDFLNGLRKPVLNFMQSQKEQFFDFDFQYPDKQHMLKIITRHFESVYENTCLEIQALAFNYYLSVWKSLCPEEQRTLYDIALDDMVNPVNREIASRLAGIGLVKRLEHLTGYEIMSKSFRNFIFTQLDKKEIRRLRDEEAQKGSWNNFQLPILIVIIAISIFLFTTQKDAFTGMVTYLGTAIGAVITLLKLLGMVPSNK